MVAPDHHRRFQFAACHHFVEGKAEFRAIAQSTQQMRAGSPWNFIFSRAASSQ